MRNGLLIIVSMVLNCSLGLAADHDPKVIIPMLKDAKISLLQGIEMAERAGVPVTSAKYEVDNGKLILSIYVIPEGLGIEPEKATLTEVSGVATESPFKPKSVVFTDKEHIARATVHMTLFQLSRYSLKQAILAAVKYRPGTPIDVRNPMVRGKRAVADIVIAGTDGNAYSVTVDLLGNWTLSESIQ
jgi:hypothetical protein